MTEENTKIQNKTVSKELTNLIDKFVDGLITWHDAMEAILERAKKEEVNMLLVRELIFDALKKAGKSDRTIRRMLPVEVKEIRHPSPTRSISLVTVAKMAPNDNKKVIEDESKNPYEDEQEQEQVKLVSKAGSTTNNSTTTTTAKLDIKEFESEIRSALMNSRQSKQYFLLLTIKDGEVTKLD